MDYNKKCEALLGIGLDDYPGSDYSPIEEYYNGRSSIPRFISRKKFKSPLFDLFEEVEVLTFHNLYNRVMSFIAPNFEPAQMIAFQNLINGLADIYGGDNKGMLWLLEEETEEILLGKWPGRSWEFDRYEEIHDVFLFFDSEKRLQLTIKEKGTLLDFLDD